VSYFLRWQPRDDACHGSACWEVVATDFDARCCLGRGHGRGGRNCPLVCFTAACSRISGGFRSFVTADEFRPCWSDVGQIRDQIQHGNSVEFLYMYGESVINQGGNSRRTADTRGDRKEEHTDEYADGHMDQRLQACNTHTEQHGTPLDGRGAGHDT
jgi:hypothetical protein